MLQSMKFIVDVVLVNKGKESDALGCCNSWLSKDLSETVGVNNFARPGGVRLSGTAKVYPFPYEHSINVLFEIEACINPPYVKDPSVSELTKAATDCAELFCEKIFVAHIREVSPESDWQIEAR